MEIGGGHGDVMKELKERGHYTVNVTNNEEELKQLSNRQLGGVLKDMHNLSPMLNTFDIVLISHVFEHSFAPYVLFTEFNEVLKDKGIVIVIVPDQEEKWIYEPYHYIVPTADHLKNLGQKCGFKTLTCELRKLGEMNHLIYIGQKERYWKDE